MGSAGLQHTAADRAQQQTSAGFGNDRSCTVIELSSGHSFAVDALHACLCWSFKRCSAGTDLKLDS